MPEGPLSRRLQVTGVACAAVVLAALPGCGGDDPLDEPVRPRSIERDEFFGVNAPHLREYPLGREEELSRLAATMGGEGIGWARIVFDQAVEQRDEGETDWAVPDAIVAALAREGVRTQPLFVGTAEWAADAEGASECAHLARPEDVGAWSSFVGAAVERYGAGGPFWREHSELKPLPVTTWEIGNEPNLRQFWCPAADPAQYAEVYSASMDAALAVDPSAKVIVGGLASVFGAAPEGDVTVPDFLSGMLAAEPSLAGRIPAVGIHPYAESADGVLQVIAAYRAAMRAAGLGEVPLIADEVGWYTSGPEGYRLAEEDERAERIGELVGRIKATDCNVAGLGIHAWLTPEDDDENPEDWYGLADPSSGETSESATAYGDAIAAARKRTAQAAPVCVAPAEQPGAAQP